MTGPIRVHGSDGEYHVLRDGDGTLLGMIYVGPPVEPPVEPDPRAARWAEEDAWLARQRDLSCTDVAPPPRAERLMLGLPPWWWWVGLPLVGLSVGMLVTLLARALGLAP